MKKILALLFCIMITLIVSACDNIPTEIEKTDNQLSIAKSDPSGSPDVASVEPTEADEQESTDADTTLDPLMGKLRDEINLSDNLSFSAQTPFGDEIDSSIFSDYDLTMINIWGTLCKPCIEEMPDIQKLYEDMLSNGVNVIGFVANYQDDRVEKAQEIITDKNITYSNVVFSDEISDAIAAQIAGFPTTIFVDKKGNVIGDQVSGEHSYDEYKTIISERLEECAR